jgi:hypothetical protein
MLAMLMSRLSKRVVGAVAGIAFLLCQSAAFAQACVTMPQNPAGAAAQQPCHGSGDESSQNPATGPHGGCQYVSSAVPDLPVYPATEAPAPIARAIHLAAMPVLPFALAPLRLEPPPHSILHCCLRN